MKLRYDKDEDILTIDRGAAGDSIDHAEEIGSVIAHFTADGRPILLEILDAGEFLSAALRAITGAEGEVASADGRLKPPLTLLHSIASYGCS